MVEKTKELAVILFVILFYLGIGNKAVAEEDPYPMFEIPVIADAYNIKTFVDNPKGTKSTNYFVKIKYPAQEVLEFYNMQFKELGFIQASNGIFGKREWDCFIDGTENKDLEIRQLLASWISPKLNAEATLALIYEKKDSAWGDELRILCQMHPVIDTEGLERFFEKLKSSSQYVNFMELLDVYRMPTGEINIEKAISENPTNNYLKEYKSIIDEINRRK